MPLTLPSAPQSTGVLDDPDITQLLGQSRDGNRDAENQVLPLVYGELRRIAAGHLRRHAPSHTLQPTELIHEAWMRLARAAQPAWESRVHFFAFAARTMRHILVDHARARAADKRGGGAKALELKDSLACQPHQSVDVLALDAALERLAAVDARKARILEVRFFAGLSLEEAAEALNLSVPTVVRETRFAQAWLRAQLAAPTQ